MKQTYNISIIFNVFFFLFLVPLTFATNKYVIHVGGLYHSFNEKDFFTKTTKHTENIFGQAEISSLGGFQVSFEWLPATLENISIEYIYQNMNAMGKKEYTIKNASYTTDIKNTTKIDLVNHIISANFSYPLTTTYVNIGGTVGYGISNYRYISEYESNTPATSDSSEKSSTDTTNGNAILVGAFINWGGDKLGGRFGVNLLQTNHADINNNSVKASGKQAYLSLQYLF